MKTREAPYVQRYRRFYEHELAAAWLYRTLAMLAKGEEDAATLRRLAVAEDAHAAHWSDLVERAGGAVQPLTRPPRRERTLAWIAKRFGLQTILPTLVRLEAADAGKYLDVPEAPASMSEEEVRHGRDLATIGKSSPARIATIESRHRVGTGGALRAATFGVNDGLVSNLALVMGVAGGAGSSRLVLLAGVAGLVAGAFSMGAGEWISVRSQRELYEREIEIEREELELFPDEERIELALIYRSKGLDKETAAAVADRIIAQPDIALDTLAREELGLDPDSLGSPWVAAMSSFVAFAVGAVLPVIPFMIGTGGVALAVAGGLSGAMLALTGASISLLTGRNAFVSSARMVLVGGVAAGMTYGIGSLIGVAVS
ncbi:MAG: VIT1/CCC1 transporter family protein [Actinomycetota bacterium]